MRYRINKRTGDRISEIGMGSAYLYEAEMEDAIRALRTAYRPDTRISGATLGAVGA